MTLCLGTGEEKSKKDNGAIGLKYVSEKWNNRRCGEQRTYHSTTDTEVALRGFKLP